MIMRREWIAALAVAVAAAALYLGGLGLMPLTDRDEGEYAAAARAMITSGDYIVPTLNGRNYLEKPILIFWAVALGEELMPGETGARLPSALAAALLILGLGALVRLASGSLLWAVMSAAALAFTPLMALTGRACLTDSLLTLFTTASLGLFFLGAEKKQGGGPWHLAAWACLGLGFLTKGPVAVAVVLPPAFIYALWQGRLWEIIKESRVLWGLLIFCLINLPWYGMAFLRLGEEFWRAFFVAQNINRFSQVLLGHGGGLFYYLPVLLLGFFPFGAAALPALARALFKNPASARQADASARLRLLAAIAAVWAFAVFSVAATKQINYILPALPFLAVLAGYYLWRLLAGEEPGRAGRIAFWAVLILSGAVWALALAAAPAGLELFWAEIKASIRPDSSEYALPDGPPLLLLWPLACAAIGAGVAAGAAVLARKGRSFMLGAVLAGGGALFCAALMLGLFPDAAGIIQQPAKEMALEVKALSKPEDRVLTYGMWKPTLFYYLDRHVARIRVAEADKLAAALGRDKPAWVLTRLSLAKGLEKMGGFKALETFNGYLLGGNSLAAERWEKGKAAQGAGAGAENGQ